MNTCLLVVDVQEGFVSKNTEHVPERIRSLLDSSVFTDVVFSRFHNAPGSPYRRLLGWNRLAGAEEQRLRSEIAEYAETVIDKAVYTAVTPALIERFKSDSVDTVFIAGIDTDCCVLTTAVDLFEAGIRPVVLSHYCASNGGAANHTAALTCLDRLIGLHNIVGGELDAHRLEEVLQQQLPAPTGPGLEKLSEFAATRADVDRCLRFGDRPPALGVLELLDIDFRDSLDASVGVWEQYSLREHIFMVVGQYVRYFANRPIVGIEADEMLLLLGLHDIGKPAAVRAGDKKRQHEYTLRMGDAFLHHLGYDEEDRVRCLARAMSAGDPIGTYLKTGELEPSVQTLREGAETAGMSVGGFLEFMLVYFMVDASSYTSDAGMPDGRPGFESLDWLFSFDHDSGELRFSEDAQTKVAALRRAVADA